MSDAEGTHPDPPREQGGSPPTDPRMQASRQTPKRGADLIAKHGPPPHQSGGIGAKSRVPKGKGGYAREDPGNGSAQAGKPGARHTHDVVPPSRQDGSTSRGKGGNAAAPPPRNPLKGYRAAVDYVTGRQGRNTADHELRKARRRRRKEIRKTDSPAQESEGSGKLKKLAVLVALPVLLPLFAILMMIMLILVNTSIIDQTRVQPDDKSDTAVAKYIPKGWQDLLNNAAKTTSAGPSYANVPWTILAGIVQTQTDFGRYSPYDNIDRDPGRDVAEIAPGGSESAGATDTSIGITSGAGPGPVGGVSGSGESAPLSPGHPGPPSGDVSHQLGWFMWALRMHESGGGYTRQNPGSGACGAYQYLNSTWQNYGGYPSACVAPPSIQDRRAVADVLAAWQKYHTWEQAAAGHLYPAWAQSPEKWGSCPAGCGGSGGNPTVWGYVDDVMTKMGEISQKYPADSPAPVPSASAASPASFDGGSRSTAVPVGSGPTHGTGMLTGGGSSHDDMVLTDSGSSHGARLAADGCIASPKPDIGGKGAEGTGPYLLTPAAAANLRNSGGDPNDPCASSEYVAQKLSAAANQVHGDSASPPWVPNGTAADMENARNYWSKVIDVAGIFTDRSFKPGQPCALPPPDDAKKPWSVSYKIIYMWRCETDRMPDLYVIKSGQYAGGKFTYTVEDDRYSAAQTLISEALSVSYGAGNWKTDQCDNKADSPQGIFPMTKQEAAEANVPERCDQDQNIDGAAKLVLSVEKIPPEQRDHTLGSFQPMIGGWAKLGIAMGQDLQTFSTAGPGTSFNASRACTTVMTTFLTSIAPYASSFAALKEPPKASDLNGWRQELADLQTANKINDPRTDPACAPGSWAPGFNGELSQIATGLADKGIPGARNLNGLGNYYQTAENSLKPADPVPGRDSLVVPRLAPRPMNEIDAPIAPDATSIWSDSAPGSGGQTQLSQTAVDYAWFYGGVIDPFNSAEQRIGSLKNASAGSPTGPVQVSVGPDGCPENAPPNTLLDGSNAIGVHQLCSDSVAKARSPQAAAAIKWALNSLGWPYTQNIDGINPPPTRTTGKAADCSSFVTRAYRDSGAIPNLFHGNAPTTLLRDLPWAVEIPFSQAQPGDLIEPTSGHVVMHLADGYNVQESDFGEVSHVRREYTSAFWTGWVDPSKV